MMKNYLTIIILVFSLILCSCNKTDLKDSSTEKEKNETQAEPIKIVGKKNEDKIVGKYYVVFFNNFLSDGFELLTEKPEYYFMLFAIEFKSTGDIIFDDLTESYDCGNGILSIKKGSWKVNEEEIYELTFDGEYALESKFHTVSTYKLVEEKKGSLKMKLDKVQVRDVRNYW